MQSENKQVLENKYWGFKVKYPEEWISWESETGSRYYIENYDGRDMDVWYVPTQDQLRVRISIIDRDMGQDYIGVSTDLMTENIQGPLMGGVQSKKVVWKGDLSGYEKASHQRNGYPQSHIDRGHHMIQYIVLNNGFTYILSAEPADSILVNKFEEIVSSFEFIERGPIYEEFQGEFPENVSVHQNTRFGFSLEYPSGLEFYQDSEYPEAASFGNTGSYRLAEAYNQEYGDFAKDIARYVSLICAADGPDGGMHCPEEDVVVSKFQNSKGVEGYKLTRKIVWTSYNAGERSTTESFDTLIAYKIVAPDYYAIIFDTYEEEEQSIIDIADKFKYLQEKQ